MLEPAVIVLRLMQYAGAMILLGSPLFFIYALPRSGAASAAQTAWARPLLAGAGALLAIAALLSLPVHASILAGSIRDGVKPETLLAVITGMDLGKAAICRAVAAGLAALLVLVLKPGRPSWGLTAALGAVAVASFAWMGHGAATEGPIAPLHLAADIVHGWAAALWVGALVVFALLLLARPRTSESVAALHSALQGFSGIGALLVATLVLTGMVNSAVLVGLDRIEGLWTTSYGRLLSLKILLFTAMVGLAAANRYCLAPALGGALREPAAKSAALAALRRSVVVEAGLSLLVLALVAWFGTLPPPSVH
ncbi:copper homeostasis membrane protein CopD [Caulobacter hibisci]|uniref:Copper homeostasis membrane protein CopD n=1 Tax=Caulobacter hibisci TaxID=2035993 RepID=A0ABS0T229_9CAUL|nr:copper homeostasis membrane protein CopD [Caulobacter hibisci]